MSGHAQSHFRLDDVVVPKENVLVRGSEAFEKQLESLNWERMANVTLCHVIGRCALDRAIDHAASREQFGQPIGEFQGIEWKLADMARELETSRSFAHQIVSRASERGRVPDPLYANMAKVTATEVAGSVVDEALQIHGAAGYQRGHPMEYLYRLIRGTRISGGTNEVLRNTIARLLKRDGLRDLV